MNDILKKLSEPSTIRGLIGLIGAAGIVIEPELMEQIVALAMALIGIINVVRKERTLS